MTKSYINRKKALESRDPNRILWWFDRRSALAFFMHSLNAVSASKCSDDFLLSLKGIGPKVIDSLHKAIKSSKEESEGFEL